jgi:hypothetical protein
MVRKKSDSKQLPPALTPEGMLDKLTKKAFDVANRQLDDGTIAPSTLNALLRFGTAERELQLEAMKSNKKLSDSKIELIESEVKGKGDSEAVIAAIRGYAPSEEL